MDSRLMLLVFFVIACDVPCIKAVRPTTNLTSNITRNGCGINKLCVENPAGCDPSGSSQCFFASSHFSSTNKSLAFEISGNSPGYITLATGVNSLLSQGTNIVFVCGNNNGSFFFQTTTLINNTQVITNWLNVSNIQGSIRKSLIQCAFNIPIDVNSVNIISTLTGINTTNFNNTNLANTRINAFIEIFQGSTNGTVLGPLKSTFGSSFFVNLANASSIVVNTAPTTAITTTTNNPNSANITAASFVNVANSSISLTSLMCQAAIALLGIFTLCLL
ncbi:putative ferric-chelate reductase 1 [Xyrauchen texanus]|uniref:putative ferric-chelate reductase 1 n=1 Tax=Xyrauchen texanus TaxID=154827 RepID=UPI00224276D4|nr:putative ferric-chelate reductase 1 [Xyrauchen texanus]